MKSYDFIIVGAGASGCVLANRLSRDPTVSVLLVEAGSTDSNPLLHMPRGFARALSNPRLTHVYPVNRPGWNEPEYWLRGKTLGGSTAINGMMYLRGFPRDYDQWEEEGCPGWGWHEIARCFKALEAAGEMSGDTSVEPGFRTSIDPARGVLNDAIVRAAEEMGLGLIDETLENAGPGFGYGRRSIWRGRRTSAATAFLHPIRSRKNLTILTDTTVERVTFTGRQATGVVVHGREGRQELLAQREVILSAGAIVSPKILLHSGIGPAEQLRAVGVPLLFDAPQVGQNLREHLLVTMQFDVSHGSANRELRSWRLLANVLRYQLLRAGPLTHGASEFCGFAKIRADADRPDVQLLGSPVTTRRTAAGYAIGDRPGFSLGGYVLRPESRGEIRLQSADVNDPLLIQANYLSERIDQDTAIGMVKFIRELVARPALRDFAVAEITPGSEAASDTEILGAINRIGSSAFHAIGTCRMGSDKAAVVDPRLRVQGVAGLRVVDISVLPTMVSGNTQGPALALGWRASELIMEERAAA